MEYAGSEGQGLLKSQKHKPSLYLCCGVSDRQPLVLSQWAAPLPACSGRRAGSGSRELAGALVYDPRGPGELWRESPVLLWGAHQPASGLFQQG